MSEVSDDSRESQHLPLPPGAAGLVLPVPHQVSLHPGQSAVEEREDQGDGRGLQLETAGDSVGEERHPGQVTIAPEGLHLDQVTGDR